MKLSARKDVEASAADLFQVLADFDHYERLALHQGADVERSDGPEWVIRFSWRGRARRVTSRVETFDPPRALALRGASGGFDYLMAVTLVPLSRNHTRLGAELDVRPRTLAARILLQTLKLGKGRLQGRFAARLETFADLLARRLGVDHRA
jgi:Polyketide cyclase / dehydrase and lipid transport